MERPVFVLITINGQRGIGPRYVAAACEAAGAETHLLHFKLFYSREVSHAESKRLKEDGKSFVVRIHPQGDELIPFPNDVTEEELNLLVEELRRIGPTHIGISFTSVDLDKAECVTAAIHSEVPGVPVVWGGIHATLNPETSICHADVVCVGEGEEALVEYLGAPNRRDVAGLWFRDGEKIVRNPLRPLIADLDRLPFPMYGGNEIYIDENALHVDTREVAEAVTRNFQIVTARGCPFSCSYCLHAEVRKLYPGQKYVRRRSVENVMREIELRASQGSLAPYVPFYDEVFVRDAKWIDAFAPEYDRRIALPFAGYAHEAMSSPDMLRALHNVGMAGTTLAFQSGSEWICREVYNRRNDFDRMVATSQTIQDIGYDLLVYEALSDTPFETDEDCRATLEFLLRLPTPFYLQLFRLVIFPGSEIEKAPQAAEPLSATTFQFWDMLYLLAQSPHLARETVRALADDPFLRANPHVLEDVVESLFPDDNLARLIAGVNERTIERQRERFPRSPSAAGASRGEVATGIRNLIRRAKERLSV